MGHYKNSVDKLIIELVQKNIITEQADLLRQLKKEGVSMPQSTLSRHLKNLSIVKIRDRYVRLEQVRYSRSPIQSVKISPPNFIVVRTLPGYANSIAVQLDKKISDEPTTTSGDPYSGLLGTIAGDDTIFVITQDSQSAQLIKDAIIDEFGIFED